MVYNFNRHQGFSKPAISRLMAFLSIGCFSMISTSAYGHPHTSKAVDPAAERLEKMENKRDQIRERAEEGRIKAQERSSALRKEAAERRERHKQESHKRRAENEDKKAKHLSFKTQLLAMLVEDKVIASEADAVAINYVAGDPIANGINLTSHFGDKYKALWLHHNRAISEQSYLKIMPKSYEIREIAEDGASHHLVIQTN